MELEGKMLDVTLSVQQARNGKFFYNFMEWGEFGADGRGEKRPPGIRGPSGEGGRGNGGGSETGGSTPRRPTAPDGGARAYTGSTSDTTISASADAVNSAENRAAADGLTGIAEEGHTNPELREMLADDLRVLLFLSQERFQEFIKLIEDAPFMSREGRQAALEVHRRVATEPAGGVVNLEVRDITPDWTPEPPEREVAPAGPASPEERAALDRAMDAEAARLIQEGHATSEERAALERHKGDVDAVNREEEAGLSVLECITGAGE